jgi:hypothetical protein
MKKFCLVPPTVALIIGLSSFSSTASAQSADAQYIVARIANATNPAAKTVVDAINQVYSHLKTYMTYDWTEKQPNLSKITEPQNILATQLTATQDAAVNGLSANAIASVIGPVVRPNMASYDLSIALASNFANDVLPPSQQQSAAAGASAQTLQLCGNNMFNFESLMGYSTYANQTLACNPGKPQNVSQYASQYIQYVTGAGIPMSNYSITDAVYSATPTLTRDQAKVIMQSPEYINFTLLRRSLLALDSATQSNLNYLFNQRAPDSNGNSPESVANYIANWRTQNVNGWYDTMSTTADLPILLRENLFIMAEIQRDLHEMRKENQRSLATLSILLSQGSNVGKQFLTMRFTGLQKKVSEIKTPPSTQTIP